MQETLDIGQWCLSRLQSRHFETSLSSSNCHQLPCCIFPNVTDSLKCLPFQWWFYFWEKPEVTGCQIWLYGGWCWVTWVIWCFAKISAWDVIHEQAWCHDKLQSPVAHSSAFLNYLKSFHGGNFKLNEKFDADSFIVLLTQSFWMWWPHSTHVHSMASTILTD